MDAKKYLLTGLTLLVGCGRLALAQSAATAADSTVKLTAEPTTLKPIAYGAQPLWQITGALSTVSGADLQKSFTSNLANTL